MLHHVQLCPARRHARKQQSPQQFRGIEDSHAYDPDVTDSPPSTIKACPVIFDASSLARKFTAAAI